MKDKLRTTIRSKMLPYIGASILFLLLSLFQSLIDALPQQFLLSLRANKLFVPLLTSSGLAIIFALIIILLIREPKYTLKDAVYWDKNNQPHCPACKTPIIFTQYNESRNETTYHCMKCKKWGYAHGIHIIH